MRYRINNYIINGLDIILPRQVTIEDIKSVINETQKIPICSSMRKDRVSVQSDTITVPTNICVLDASDQLTIEVDFGDNLEDVSTILDNIDMSSVETKIDESTTTLSDKIDNIQVDLSPVAKQGDNTEATNTAILAAIKSLSSAYLVKNTDGDNTYTLTIKSMTSMRVDGDAIIV